MRFQTVECRRFTRADVNLSLKPKGSNTPGVRTEMKNLNSLRAVQRAAQAEAERQARILDAGQEVYQETRRWDDHKGESFVMRGKEESMDYRYFPEPDLPPVCLDENFVRTIKKSMPELPGMRRERYVNQFGIRNTMLSLLNKTYILQTFLRVPPKFAVIRNL